MPDIPVVAENVGLLPSEEASIKDLALEPGEWAFVKRENREAADTGQGERLLFVWRRRDTEDHDEHIAVSETTPVAGKTCPECGSKASIQPIPGGMIEIGAYDGDYYEMELDLDGFTCLDCDAKWWSA